MNQYYLISQLPSLDGISNDSPLPISEKRFYELCADFLSKKALRQFNSLTLIPDINQSKTGSSFIDSWNEGERLLRLALATVRAGKMNKSFDNKNISFSPALIQAARAAADNTDPLEAEQTLNKYRLELIEAIRPSDAFCEDAVFYYGLKLKLLSRIKGFDEAEGQKQYKKIYNSIINGEEQEA